jgi:hypothetical protein
MLTMRSDGGMGTLGPKATDKVSGPAWNRLRDKFFAISRHLLDVSPDAFGELTTIYVKFTVTAKPSSPVFAAIWVKNSKSLTVGLSLPEELEDAELGLPPQGMKYKGLTRYFVVDPDKQVPEKLHNWSELAYRHVLSQMQDS